LEDEALTARQRARGAGRHRAQAEGCQARPRRGARRQERPPAPRGGAAAARARGEDRRLKSAASIAFALWIAATPALRAETLTGKVVSIADGDTITVLVDRVQCKLRLHRDTHR